MGAPVIHTPRDIVQMSVNHRRCWFGSDRTRERERARYDTLTPPHPALAISSRGHWYKAVLTLLTQGVQKRGATTPC
eukprot:5373090-Prymnesium_polylepis.1